jgi:glucosylceramidase
MIFAPPWRLNFWNRQLRHSVESFVMMPRLVRKSLLVCAAILALWATPQSPAARAVNIWLTSGDKSQLLKQNADVVFEPGTGSGGTLITVSPTTTFQTMSGFGAALTDSSAWLMQNRMNPTQRDKLLQQLFSPESGIGINYLRLPMGASDFTASGFYSYNDNPPGGSDPSQANFSIAHDEAYIIPQLQRAKELNPDLKIMASPWSAPAWMKTNSSLTGGSLRTNYEASYALYLAKFVQACEAEGLPIDALTLQNEPLHTSNYPTMSMSATQQTNLIKNHVGPLFQSEGIDTKIVVYDHNWDNTDYPLQVLDDPAARQYVAGTAFHGYSSVSQMSSAQTSVHNAYPDKDIYFTEVTGSGNNTPTSFANNMVWTLQNIFIGATRNWAKTGLLWNMALDQNNGPHQGGCTDCRGVVTVDSNTGNVTFNEEFYSLGQMTKAVQADAVRINSTTNNTFNTVAFTNPDGSTALVALNPNSSASTIRVYFAGEHFTYQVPGKSVATFLWDAAGADFDNGSFDQGAYHLGGGSLDAWTSFGNAIGNVGVSSEAVLDGEKSLKLFGQFNGQPNTSGLFQGISVTPGEYIQGSLNALVRSPDSIANTSNLSQMKIEFYSDYGANYGSAEFLGELLTTIADGSTPNDSWQQTTLGGVVPSGAVEARLVLQFVQPTGQAGAVHLDDVTFGVVESPLMPGDFNRDGRVDSADLEIWSGSYGINAFGDANGDGHTDGYDFLIWQRHFGTGLSSVSHLIVPEPSGQSLCWLAGPLLHICFRLRS